MRENKDEHSIEDIYSDSTPETGRLPKKRNVKRIIINIAASVTLLISSLALCGMLLLNSRPLNDGDYQLPVPEDTEPVQPSTHEDVSYFLVAGLDLSESLTDIMMIVCFDHGKNEASILQIPRDTFVGSDIPTGKVNAVYNSASDNNSKMRTLMSRINTHFGLPVDHYFYITIDGFRNLVDSVDGVTIKLDKSITIENSVNKTSPTIGPGEVLLDGGLAEGFVRHRNTYFFGDLDRVKAQRLFYAAFVDKVLNMSSNQLVKVATSCYDKVGTDLSVGEMLGYVNEAAQLNINKIKIFAVPGESIDTIPEGLYEKLSYFSVHKQEYVDLINENFLPYDDPITLDDIAVKELHNTDYPNKNQMDDNTDLGSLLDGSGNENSSSE